MASGAPQRKAHTAILVIVGLILVPPRIVIYTPTTDSPNAQADRPRASPDACLCMLGRVPEGCRQRGPLGDAYQQFPQSDRHAHEVCALNGIQVDAQYSSPRSVD